MEKVNAIALQRALFFLREGLFVIIFKMRKF